MVKDGLMNMLLTLTSLSSYKDKTKIKSRILVQNQQLSSCQSHKANSA